MTTVPHLLAASADPEKAISLRFRARAGTGSDFTLALDLQLPGEGISAVFGASGSGKTTLLRCVAGLAPVQSGSIVINNETWHDSRLSLPAHERPVGYVFQEASLFEHLTAAGNLEFAEKRVQGLDEGTGFPIERKQIVELMGIDRLLQRRPSQLSGGERQRVAIARALLIRPRLLLMDEPLAALDAGHKQEILPYLETLHREIQIPVLYVTHSVDEVSRLADHLLVLQDGQALASGPVGPILSGLRLGDEAGAVLEGQLKARDTQWNLALFSFAGGELWVRDRGQPLHADTRVRVLARDVSLSLAPAQQSSILNSLPAVVASIEENDEAMALVGLRLGDASLSARVSRRSVAELALRPGLPVYAQVKSVAILR